jgi:molecular chaperone GrpE
MINQETDNVHTNAQPKTVNDEDNRTNLQDKTEKKSENATPPDKLSDGAIREETITDEPTADDASAADDSPADEKTQELHWKEKYATLNDSHLRLMAEFDNYRKRTLREKAELIRSGGATALENLLPVIDDFERALETLPATEDLSAAVEGVKLIHNKFIGYLAQQGVKAIEAVGQPFDTEQFEAIATVPTTDETMKGQVIDCIQTGYRLYDKVLRHAKVVVGE